MLQSAFIFLTLLIEVQSIILHFHLQIPWPLAHLEQRSPPWWGEQAEHFQSKDLPHSLQSVAMGHTDDLGINGNYGLSKFRGIRKT